MCGTIFGKEGNAAGCHNLLGPQSHLLGISATQFHTFLFEPVKVIRMETPI